MEWRYFGQLVTQCAGHGEFSSKIVLLPPANEVCEGCVVTGVCPHGGVWLLPGDVWLLPGGGMHGCLGGTYGCSQGACVVAPGGACMGYDETWRYDQ